MMIFEETTVEIFELNDVVYFNPRNVGECLGIVDVKSSIRDFSDKQLKKLTNSDVHTTHIRKLNNAGELFLTESGVYKLIFKSRKPNAEKFQDWVADEVLPSIRKTGSYTKPKSESNSEMLKEELVSRAMAANLKTAKLLGLEGNQAILSANVCLKSFRGIDCLAEFQITGLVSKDQIQYFTPTLLGKKIGISAIKINKGLEKAGLQTKQRDYKDRPVWEVTPKGKEFCQLIDTGKKKGSGSTILQIKWSSSILDKCEFETTEIKDMSEPKFKSELGYTPLPTCPVYDKKPTYKPKNKW